MSSERVVAGDHATPALSVSGWRWAQVGRRAAFQPCPLGRGLPWLEAYRPWGVSPFSFLEIQFLAEVGRLAVAQPELYGAVSSDPRFIVDEPPLVPLVEKALALSWTRDPFDRLLAAHSETRRVPLCSLGRRIRDSHRFLVEELRS